ncbi:MAG: hypothetical protein LUD22_01195 [Coprobacillus sp.]|nr:hypothetical protein [Coprobacillus sp.]
MEAKYQKRVLQLVELLRSEAEIKSLINALPRGYISKKTISGHTYYYRQWREGSRIISKYVEPLALDTVSKKIALRKEQEKTLSDIKASIRSSTRYMTRNGILDNATISTLRKNATYDTLTPEWKRATLEENLPEYVDTKLGDKFLEGEESYNHLYLESIGIL